MFGLYVDRLVGHERCDLCRDPAIFTVSALKRWDSIAREDWWMPCGVTCDAHLPEMIRCAQRGISPLTGQSLTPLSN